MRNSTLNVKSGTISNNNAPRGAAIRTMGGTLKIDNGTFSGNTATLGGAMYVGGKYDTASDTKQW